MEVEMVLQQSNHLRYQQKKKKKKNIGSLNADTVTNGIYNINVTDLNDVTSVGNKLLQVQNAQNLLVEKTQMLLTLQMFLQPVR